MQTVQMSQNPMATLQQMAQNNPKLQKTIDYIKENGGDPKAAFYKLAGEMGKDPDEYLKSISNGAL